METLPSPLFAVPENLVVKHQKSVGSHLLILDVFQAHPGLQLLELTFSNRYQCAIWS